MRDQNNSHLSRRHVLRRMGAVVLGGTMAASGQALLFGASAQAQTYSLVGTWSAQTTLVNGEVTGTIFTVFGQDGRFSQRIVVRGGTTDYAGVYRLSPDGTVLQSIYQDYAPKQSCRYGACYPVTPVVQMNQPVSTRINWVRPNLFFTEDAGGQVRWIRQG